VDSRNAIQDITVAYESQWGVMSVRAKAGHSAELPIYLSKSPLDYRLLESSSFSCYFSRE
jgi:hypothetical protein